jgi:L-ribulose-5-phosphate 3-epimerase
MMKRREFVAGGATALLLGATRGWAAELSQFKLGVITDEVSQDFEKSLAWAKGFGLEWVELRFLWGKYVTDLASEEVERAKGMLAKYGMRVSVIDSSYYKTLLPGTESRFASAKDPLQSPYAKQGKLLENAIMRAKDFGTDKIRIFAFLRVAEPKTVFDRVAAELEKTAEVAEKQGIRLVLENEFTCNVATGVEGAAMLAAVKAPALGFNWDPGNAYEAGELKPYPDGYAPLDKNRLWHMHLKDAQPGTGASMGGPVWRPVGGGKIDYVGQFRALLKDRYAGTMSLETHYLNAAKDKEASSRESMDGLLDVIRNA